MATNAPQNQIAAKMITYILVAWVAMNVVSPFRGNPHIDWCLCESSNQAAIKFRIFAGGFVTAERQKYRRNQESDSPNERSIFFQSDQLVFIRITEDNRKTGYRKHENQYQYKRILMSPTDSLNLIIIPTFCEEQNVEDMIRAISEKAPGFHVLIVNDMSLDDTGKIVKSLQSEFSHLHLVERNGPRGLGRAYLDGFRWGLERNYEFILQMDCDFSHDPGDLVALREAGNQADLVIGSRYVNGIRILNWPLRRLLLSYCASVYIRTITGLPVLDPTGGFKCFRREALQALDFEKVLSNGYAFQLEVNFRLWNSGFRIEEHPIVFTERRKGQSKMHRKIVFEALWTVWWLRIQAGAQSILNVFPSHKVRSRKLSIDSDSERAASTANPTHSKSQ